MNLILPVWLFLAHRRRLRDGLAPLAINDEGDIEPLVEEDAQTALLLQGLHAQSSADLYADAALGNLNSEAEEELTADKEGGIPALPYCCCGKPGKVLELRYAYVLFVTSLVLATAALASQVYDQVTAGGS
jgi:hypothetical protein